MIRKFEKKDFNSIVSIYDSVKLDRSKLGDFKYCASVQQNGFLLGLDSSDDIKKEIERSYITLVYEEDGEVKGYLIADNSEDQKFMDDEYKFWFDAKLKDCYYNNPKGMSISSVAVDPGFFGKGVATELLKELENELKNKSYEYLFSIIPLAPLTNCSSLVWHTKNGFSRLATGKPRRLWELDNYVGVLMYKKLHNTRY